MVEFSQNVVCQIYQSSTESLPLISVKEADFLPEDDRKMEVDLRVENPPQIPLQPLSCSRLWLSWTKSPRMLPVRAQSAEARQAPLSFVGCVVLLFLHS